MKRRLFNILSSLSLLLCVALVALWVRSYRSWDSLRYIEPSNGTAGEHSVHGVSSTDGHLLFEWGYCIVAVTPTSNWSFDGPGMGWRPGGRTIWNRAFYYQASLSWTSTSGPHTQHFLGIHDFWFVAGMAVLPAVWLGRFWGRRRRCALGLCVTCGYDLRASKERCPECGTPIPAGASPAGEDRPVSRPS